MLTRIRKTEMQKGMFVEAVECPGNEFAKRRFVLSCDHDFRTILNSPAEFVVINTAMGGSAGAPTKSSANPTLAKPLSKDEARLEAAATIARSMGLLKTELYSVVTGKELDMENVSTVVSEIAHVDKIQFASLYEVSRLRTKDEATFQHSLSVALLMGRLGEGLNLDTETVEMLVLAGMLHDVGKLTIPNTILLKPGSLTPAEWKLVRQHPTRGHKILKGYDGLPPEVLEICLHHHEVLDGSGYPARLSGSQISEFVRISTVCDVFDALTAKRSYKDGWSTSDAFNWLFERDHLFDRRLVLRLGGLIDA